MNCAAIRLADALMPLLAEKSPDLIDDGCAATNRTRINAMHGLQLELRPGGFGRNDPSFKAKWWAVLGLNQ